MLHNSPWYSCRAEAALRRLLLAAAAAAVAPMCAETAVGRPKLAALHAEAASADAAAAVGAVDASMWFGAARRAFRCAGNISTSDPSSSSSASTEGYSHANLGRDGRSPPGGGVDVVMYTSGVEGDDVGAIFARFAAKIPQSCIGERDGKEEISNLEPFLLFNHRKVRVTTIGVVESLFGSTHEKKTAISARGDFLVCSRLEIEVTSLR